MIVCEQKPIEEIKGMLSSAKKVAIIGCGTCTTVCMAGGEKEVKILSQLIKLAFKKEGKEIDIIEQVIKRQCEKEFLDSLSIDEADTLLCCGCGIGTQMLSERFPEISVFPALNTRFMGTSIQTGVWVGWCLGCGNCVLHHFFGICPITRCAKGLMNGPCGGSMNGMCEVRDNPCAWNLIYNKAKEKKDDSIFLKFFPPKDWSSSFHGGVQKIVHPEAFYEESS